MFELPCPQTVKHPAGDKGQSAELIAECAAMSRRLEKMTLGEGQVNLYESLVELIIPSLTV